MLVKNNSSWMFLEPLGVSVGSRLVRWWQRIIVLLFDKQKWERAKKKRKNTYFVLTAGKWIFHKHSRQRNRKFASGHISKPSCRLKYSHCVIRCSETLKKQNKWEQLEMSWNRKKNYICTQSDTFRYDSDGSFISYLTSISNSHVVVMWSKMKRIHLASLFPQLGK